MITVVGADGGGGIAADRQFAGIAQGLLAGVQVNQLGIEGLLRPGVQLVHRIAWNIVAANQPAMFFLPCRCLFDGKLLSHLKSPDMKPGASECRGDLPRQPLSNLLFELRNGAKELFRIDSLEY